MIGGASVFNRNSFSTQSFSRKSWWMDAIESTTRFVVRLKSNLTQRISNLSRLW